MVSLVCFTRTYISTGVQYEDLDVGVSWRQQDRWCFDGTVDSCLVRYITPYTAHDKPLDSTIEHHPHLQLSRNLNIFLLNFELIDRIVDVKYCECWINLPPQLQFVFRRFR